MLLAVDIGNTQTHLGAFEGEELIEHWRFQTRSGATGDELGERIAGFFNLSDMNFGDIDSVVVSSVVPPLGSQFERMTERYLEAECLTIGPGVKSGMPIRIDNPLEVGADRLVNAIAAYERFGEACVVVDFGTGINIDAVSADGATRLIVTAYIGIGNRLFIRGDGPGLSWEKGVPLTFVSIGKWRWETNDATGTVRFKIFKNDETECTALGERTVEPGAQLELSASF